MKSMQIIIPGLIFLLAACKNTTLEINEPSDADFLIAYNVFAPDSMNEDNYELFLMGMDGSKKMNITNNADVAWTYLAVNDKILFVSDRDACTRCYYLYEMDTDGNNINKISDIRLRDSWMSSRYNGEELIVNPHPEVDSAFYIIDRQGNVMQKIYTGLKKSSDPAFSPDGEQIVFSGGNRKSKREEGYQEEIYLMNSDGSGLQQLTKYPENDTTAAWYAYKAGPPKWHPTEDFISYPSFQNGKYSLYAVDPEASRHWKLTDIPQDEVYHSWSPDGRWLALDISDNDQTQFHIALVNWENREVKILTDTSYHYQQAPVFVLTSN